MFRLRFTGVLATVLGVLLLLTPVFQEEKDAAIFTAMGLNFLLIGLICLGIVYFIGRRRG